MTPREESRLFDVRVVDRNLRKGIISKKDYDKYLKSLEDRASNAVASVPDAGDDDDEE